MRQSLLAALRESDGVMSKQALFAAVRVGGRGMEQGPLCCWWRIGGGIEDSVFAALRVGCEGMEQALLTALRVSGGGKELEG